MATTAWELGASAMAEVLRMSHSYRWSCHGRALRSLGHRFQCFLEDHPHAGWHTLRKPVDLLKEQGQLLCALRQLSLLHIPRVLLDAHYRLIISPKSNYPQKLPDKGQATLREHCLCWDLSWKL